MAKRLMDTTTLSAVVKMIEAGMIEDFAVVATFKAEGGCSNFSQPPADPDRLVAELQKMIEWVSNSEAHDVTRASIAELDAAGQLSEEDGYRES
jgi:hypothetical protein